MQIATINPLINGGRDQLTIQDNRRIMQNYSGQKTNFDNTNQRQGTVTFTLYPDGSIRWPHRNYRYSNRKNIDDQTFNLTVAALKKSAPLHLAVASSISRPKICNLFLNFEYGELNLNVGIEEAVLYGKYHYTRNSPPLNKGKWLAENIAKIRSTISASQSKRFRSADGIKVIWFRVNPNGLIDDWDVIQEESKSGKRSTASRAVALDLSQILRSSQPLKYQANADEPNGPIELLLIFDPAAKDNFKLAAIHSAGPDLRFIVEN